MRTTVLCSGSFGNSIAVQCNGHFFLVEAGISPGKCAGLLHDVGLRLAHMRAVLCSHNHSDHAGFIPQYAKRGIRGGIGPAGVSLLDGIVECRAFRVPHDAAPPGAFGFHFVESSTGAALAIISDAGSFNKEMRDAINASDAVIIGVDYDEQMESEGNYNVHLQERIRSNTGHLSNQQLQEFLRTEWNGRAAAWILAHLSGARNNPDLAIGRFSEAIQGRTETTTVFVSTPKRPTPVIPVNPYERSTR